MINENDRWHLTMEVRNALADKFPSIATPYRVAKAAVDVMIDNPALMQSLVSEEWWEQMLRETGNEPELA